MFIDELKESIRRNRPLPVLLDGFISIPKKKNDNPLVKWAVSFFGEDKVKAYVIEAIRGYLPQTIQNSQEALCELNTQEGRDYLHKNLDELLNYLTSEKYMIENEYRCPCCGKSFFGQQNKCPCCNKGLRWK